MLVIFVFVVIVVVVVVVIRLVLSLIVLYGLTYNQQEKIMIPLSLEFNQMSVNYPSLMHSVWEGYCSCRVS